MLKSLQTCHLDDNEKLLEKHIASTQGNIELCSHSDDRHSIRKGFMSFDEGFALFLGYMQKSVRSDLMDRKEEVF